MSESRKYRSWTAEQKLEIVLAGMRGDRSVRDVCREHGIAETLYYGWRDRILEAGRGALAGKEERTGQKELRRKIAELFARRRPSNRRHLQIALGVLWLLDGALQAQAFMFTRGFAVHVIAPAGQGQPGVV